MANETKLTETYESLPLIAKVVLQLILGAIVGGLYRIIRYTETKNTTTLVVGILCLIPPISFVAWIADIVTEVTSNRITLLAD